MRSGLLGIFGAFTLVGAAAGTACSNGSGDDGTGGTATGGSAGASGATTGGTPSTGGSGGTSSGGTTSTGGTSGAAGGGGGPTSCSNVTACGGNVVGIWNVASSCLKLSGEMDMTLASLGCATVPVDGFLTTTGNFVANANGTYADNTTTTGTLSFPLAPSCLSISSVQTPCDRIGSIFTALGWDTVACTETNGMCGCVLSTVQQGGMGAIVPFTEPTGAYTTNATDNTLTATNVSYSYCTAGDTLTVTPQMSALSGTIVLQREGTGGSGGMGGMGGASGAAGSGPTGGTGGMGGGASGMGGAGTGGASGSGGKGGSGGSTGGSGGAPTGNKPCDIYAAASTPCVAAHSTVRALFSAYAGNLYQVKRADGMTKDIPVKSAGGFADSMQQESFCSGSTCTMWRIYDQSGNGNFLEAETPQSTVGGHSGMTAANAAAESLNVGGNKVYSLYTRPSQAYWRDGSASGMPLGASPQGIYMVTSGTHFNGGCCYNYGNAQLSRTYEGGPTMDSVYFGNCTIWGRGAGNGPWVMADMEDGIVSGANTGTNNSLPSMPHTYVTAVEKNNGRTEYQLRGANATTGNLSTFYKGALPAGKNPMRKGGAVVLGSGGDCCYSNNNASEGTFYEGAIVNGYPSDATDEAVHANVVSAGYGR
jgi:non-reducing end alpha-L-arabinofuranosidase